MVADVKQLCTFTLENHLFGVDARSVQEVIRFQSLTRVPLAHESVAGLINLRGQIVTAIDLRKRLRMPARDIGKLPMNVVVRADEGAVSLLVDQIGDVIEVFATDFETPPKTLQNETRHLVEGTYKLKDHLLLVLNVSAAIRVTDE